MGVNRLVLGCEMGQSRGSSLSQRPWVRRPLPKSEFADEAIEGYRPISEPPSNRLGRIGLDR